MTLKEAIQKAKRKGAQGDAQGFEAFLYETVLNLFSEKFSKEEVERIILQNVNVENIVYELVKKGLKGDRGERGPQGEGIVGPRGEKGDKPIAGVDYPIPKNGKDGRDSFVAGPKGDRGDDGSPDTPEEIARKVNSLREIIEMSSIKGLEGTVKTIMRAIRERGGSTKGSGDIVHLYDLSSSLDGATKIFTIPSHRKIVLVTSSSVPFFFRPTTDYTDTSTTITFTSVVDAPSMLAAGQSLGIQYV